MLNMIRHGANKVFASKDGDFDDADIDQLLEQGEKKTAEQQAKYADMGNRALLRVVIQSFRSCIMYITNML